MSDFDASTGQSLLDQFSTTYLRWRWAIGAGILGLTLVVWLLGAGRPYSWVVALAGLFILLHAFGSGVWEVRDPVSALIVDITVVNGAPISPQPGRPRKQMPETSPGTFKASANSAIWSHVGRSGISSPAASKRSTL